MAYLDPQHSHRRLAGVTGVALVHVALAVGLTAGLTIKYIAPPDPPIIEGRQINLPPPPPPEDTPPPEAELPRPNPAVAPEPPVRLAPDPPRAAEFDPVVVDDTTSRVVTPVLDNTVFVPEVQPPVQPAFTPRSASPRNGPRGWVTNDDYPRIAISREWEGTLTYALDIGTDGRVDNCRILSSTGHEALDGAACRMITRRARFDPATDRNGSQVAGTYRGSVTWNLTGN